MKQIYRQGDVLLIRARRRETGGMKLADAVNGRVILAYGEATGHAHAIDASKVRLYQAGDGRWFLSAEQHAELVHEEHAPISIDPGFYEVVHQREYSPAEIRRVLD